MSKRFVTIIALVLILVVFVVLILLSFNLFSSSAGINQDSEYISIKSNIETCLDCHINTKGYSNYHNPELIGCTSCHLGNKNESDKDKSHEGMILIPGNLSDAEQTCGKCHPEELKKINNSLMTTNSGLVAVDKFVFGEADSPDYHYHIKDLGFSPADKHLRDLCANCHLGAPKTEFGALGQLSRGGGCNACHLIYSEDAIKDLNTYLASDKTKLPLAHPSTDIFVTNEHCFGCHSRSSRISTNYEGWQETLLDEEDIENSTKFRVLDDKRVYLHKQEDIHFTKGLLCIDCHSSHEVMGNGKLYTHEEQAVTLQCSDCHYKEKPNTMPFDSLDTESGLVFLHRAYSHTDKPILKVEKDGHPLVNTFVDSLGNAFLIGKKDGQLHEIKPQPDICSRDHAHKNVSCSTCHSSWTSKCIGCHNQFDADEKMAYDLLDKKFVEGQWKEYVAEFSSMFPAMGVREKEGKKHIEPAVPGMILTIDKGSFDGKKQGEDVSFHRLYAPNSPHTTVKQVRDCKSCHANPESLGYGNGTLEFADKKWNFSPEYALNKNDNLPEDAWIPFLENVGIDVVNSTRTDFRPFNVNEQKTMLTVGACLQCHDDNSKVMQESLLKGLEPLLKDMRKDCINPEWK